MLVIGVVLVLIGVWSCFATLSATRKESERTTAVLAVEGQRLREILGPLADEGDRPPARAHEVKAATV
jgi:hypothetical protein